MIKSFTHKGLEEFFYTGLKKGIKPEHADRLERILDRLHAAAELKDMNCPGSNLHKLTGSIAPQKGMREFFVKGLRSFRRLHAYGPAWRTLKNRLPVDFS